MHDIDTIRNCTTRTIVEPYPYFHKVIFGSILSIIELLGSLPPSEVVLGVECLFNASDWQGKLHLYPGKTLDLKSSSVDPNPVGYLHPSA
jgi:hypothetical protein